MRPFLEITRARFFCSSFFYLWDTTESRYQERGCSLIGSNRKPQEAPPAPPLHPLPVAGDSKRESPVYVSLSRVGCAYTPSPLGHRGGLLLSRRPTSLTIRRRVFGTELKSLDGGKVEARSPKWRHALLHSRRRVQWCANCDGRRFRAHALLELECVLVPEVGGESRNKH